MNQIIIISLLVIIAGVFIFFFYRLGKTEGYVEAYNGLLKTTGLPRLTPPEALHLVTKEHEVFDPSKDPVSLMKGKGDIF